MARYTGDAEKDLDTIGLYLRGYHRDRDSDSVRVQNRRRHDLIVVQGNLEVLMYGVQPEQQVQLTLGLLAVETSFFTKGAYDMLTEHLETLEPGSTLPLVRGDTYTSAEGYVYYAGDFAHTLSLPKIGEVLCDGGTLALVPAE